MPVFKPTEISDMRLLSKRQLSESSTPVKLTRGVYFLFSKGDLVYIGKTPNVYRRVGEHLTSKNIDAYAFVPCGGSDDDLASLERAYIHKYMPELNRHKRFYEQLSDVSGTDKTKRALAHVAAGETAYRAAKREGITLSTIYRAIKRGKEPK